MSRPKSPIFAFSVISFALLLVVGLAAPSPAFADLDGVQELGANPTALSFGNVAVGTTSTPQTDTVTNTFSDDSITFSSTFVTHGYMITGTTCGSTLDPLLVGLHATSTSHDWRGPNVLPQVVPVIM